MYSPWRPRDLWGIFRVFLGLGLISFGGPIAHLGYFRHEFVEKRHWLDEHAYADLVALCQFLPGPASSKVGIALGLSRGGLIGAVLAWLGFTLPSAIALVLFGTSLSAISDRIGNSWLHGLKVVAVAVVAQALWGMGKSLAPDKARATIAVTAAVVASVWPTAIGQVGAIVAAGIVGTLFLPASTTELGTAHAVNLRPVTGAAFLVVFFVLLLGLPIYASASGSYVVKLVDSFYRAGALVFGGGHVVLPLLQAQVVPAGWVTNDAFLAGYGLAQATGPAVHLRGISRRGLDAIPVGMRQRRHRARGDLSARIFPHGGGVAVLGPSAQLRMNAPRRARHQTPRSWVCCLLLSTIRVWNSTISSPATSAWRQPPFSR